MKPLSELTLLDRFLFACAMEDTWIMQKVLEIILGREMALVDPTQVEKELRTVPWLRSVRLDVMAFDEEDQLYNTEVQRENTGNLVRRGRFYQALIDSSLLEPGDVNFNQMQDTYQIMIAPFDLFGKKRYRYTFQMKCKEEDMWLEDGVTRIFLNTKGENPQDVNPELVELLHYFEKTTDEVAADCESERIKELHERIRRIKTSEEIGVRYMQKWEEMVYAKEEGREEGVAEGKTKGIALTKRVMKLSMEGLSKADIAKETGASIQEITEILE
ncbi:Rpn family recombination-promoting nuclease/putative transposase [Clostridium sp. AN503]|uniref:Rpn family recombination-promoting nuclease/putative transposase n=1 Tax=Clostridium sp. AN503 TaxID=3160598 RepID=UPI0034586DE3